MCVENDGFRAFWLKIRRNLYLCILVLVPMIVCFCRFSWLRSGKSHIFDIKVTFSCFMLKIVVGYVDIPGLSVHGLVDGINNNKYVHSERVACHLSYTRLWMTDHDIGHVNLCHFMMKMWHFMKIMHKHIFYYLFYMAFLTCFADFNIKTQISLIYIKCVFWVNGKILLFYSDFAVFIALLLKCVFF